METTSPDDLVEYKAVVIEIPNSKENPFLQTSPFLKDTLYIIIFPVIFGLILFYIIGVVITKLHAKRQVQKTEPFDKVYEFVENNDNNDSKNPFSDKFMASEVSFVNTNPIMDSYKNKSVHSLDTISQFSMNNHRQRDSIGSTLQLNFTNPPNLQPDGKESKMGDGFGSPIFYSMVNTPAITDSSNYADAQTSRSRTDTNSTAFYSLDEPSKAMTSVTINSVNNKTRSHKRTISSHILDEFIQTGELPMLNESNDKINEINVNDNNNNCKIENHSMYENSNNLAYDIPKNNSITIRSTHSSRSPSPRRDYRMYNQYSSRSPSHSPVRNPNKSSIRDTNSPTRGSTRGDIGL